MTSSLRDALNAQIDAIKDAEEPEDAGWWDLRPGERLPFATRRPESHSPDPAVWLASDRMSHTEVSLRLAMFLLSSKLAASDVVVALTGSELTKREGPRFPVGRFLSERGFVRQGAESDWRGAYGMTGSAHALVLNSDAGGGDVMTTLASTAHARTAAPRRLVVQVTRGNLTESRSPAEHTWLRGALGRAITLESAEATDVIAVAAPRSPRFRELAAQWRGVEGMMRCGFLILIVDRTGQVDGFPREVRSDRLLF